MLVQEEYDTITRTYYRGAGACVLAFSTTDRDSFRTVSTWKKKVEAECGEIAMVLVQTKADLIDQAVVDKDEAEQLAENLGLKFYRTSVKDNLNVDLVFEDLVVLADRYAQSQGQARPSSQLPTLRGRKREENVREKKRKKEGRNLAKLPRFPVL